MQISTVNNNPNIKKQSFGMEFPREFFTLLDENKTKISPFAKKAVTKLVARTDDYKMIYFCSSPSSKGKFPFLTFAITNKNKTKGEHALCAEINSSLHFDLLFKYLSTKLFLKNALRKEAIDESKRVKGNEFIDTISALREINK